jgi:hypothetical protein
MIHPFVRYEDEDENVRQSVRQVHLGIGGRKVGRQAADNSDDNSEDNSEDNSDDNSDDSSDNI